MRFLLHSLVVFALATASASARFKPDGPHGKFQVTGWTNADQLATWKITADEAAPYEVSLLVKRAKRALAMRADTNWFQNARYGMMVHWTQQSIPLKGDPKAYEQAVAGFDVEAFADAMKSTGAGFRTATYLPIASQSLRSRLWTYVTSCSNFLSGPVNPTHMT